MVAEQAIEQGRKCKMKTLKELVHQLTRIANSMVLIEMTLMRMNMLEYTDLEKYAKDYNEESAKIAKVIETVIDDGVPDEGTGDV